MLAHVFRITFAICHMWGMSSACSNPFLYGWLNDNFRKEFKEIIGSCFGKHIKLHTPVRASTLDESRAPVKKDMTSHHQPLGIVTTTLGGDTRELNDDMNAAKVEDSEKVGTALVQDGDATKVAALSGEVQQQGSPV